MMKGGNVCLLLLLSLTVFTCRAESENETVRVNDGSDGVLKSTGFPYRCCHSSVYTIIYAGNQAGCIKLSFTDLDLPLSSSLKVYSVASSGEADLLFDRRRSYNESTSRTLLCPGIFSSARNGTVRLELANEGNAVSRYYAGFRAQFWTSQDGCLTSGGQQTSTHQPEHCQVIATVFSGEEINWKPPSGAVAEYQLVTDFVWVIKRPSYVSLEEALVSLRLVDFSVNGTFEIRGDFHSQAQLMANQSLASNRSAPLLSTGATSREGLFVHVSVDPRSFVYGPPHLHFVTGVYYRGTSTADVAGWFLCSNSNGSLYIPQRHVCDSVVHCERHEDESSTLCLSSELESTTAVKVDDEPLSFLRWLLPVIASFILLGFVIFGIKMYFRSKGHGRRRSSRRRNPEPDYTPANDNHYDPASRDPILRPSSDRIPVPSIRVPSQAVCIPIAGSFGGPGYGSASLGMVGPRNSMMMMPMPGSPTTSGPGPLRSPSDTMSRAAPISIPTAPRASVTIAAPTAAAAAAAAVPIVVQPVVHRDAGTIVPPSYEEATTEHSVGDSTDSLTELPDVMPEYHPPSYEDVSQGKTDLVSSWVLAGRSHPTS